MATEIKGVCYHNMVYKADQRDCFTLRSSVRLFFIKIQLKCSYKSYHLFSILLMWYSPLYALNVFYYHWLIKESSLGLWQGRIEQGGNSKQR